MFYNLRNIANSDKNGGMDMAFLTSLLGYLGKLVLYVILAVLGVLQVRSCVTAKMRRQKNK